MQPRNESQRWEHAVQLARHVEARWPQLFNEPAMQFPLAAAERSRGFPQQANRIYLWQTQSRSHDAWWTCAAGEQWLAAGQGEPPKSMWRVLSTPAKPKLDGELDEPFWQQARPIELRSAAGDDGEWPTMIVTAYDAEFLYLAGKCRKAKGADYSTTRTKRPRDPDLSTRDRVEIYLDLDRDYTSWFRLAIDYRGWVAEDCWHDKSWNPSWFVATGGDDETWSFEAAIPLAELTSVMPSSRHVWAAGAQRIVPKVGMQSWTQPAAAEVLPEGFGFLVFD